MVSTMQGGAGIRAISQRKSGKAWGASGIPLVILGLLSACSPGPPSGPPSAPTSEAGVPSQADIAQARAFREEFGLRSDEAWIVAVAGRDDTGEGVRHFAVPLTPDETAELLARGRNASQVEPVVDAYGKEHPAVWAGLFVDQANGGNVVALFVGDATVHEAALRRMLHPDAELEVRSATWPLVELEALQERITRDRDWFPTIDATWRGTGVLIADNKVQVSISSANPDAAAEIMRHFDAAGRITVQSDGLGPWTGGRGDVVIVASGSGGLPVAGLDCVLIPDIPTAYESGDMAWVTNSAGICRISNVGATTYTIRLVDRSSEAARTRGEARIEVLANDTTTVRIAVDP